MHLNLNGVLLSLSFAMDFVEMEILGVRSNHGKRVAYIACRMGEEIGLSHKMLFDTVSLAVLHDNAISEEALTARPELMKEDKTRLIEDLSEHCMIGERNVVDFPFLTAEKDIIKYHHEKYDGSGFFGRRGGEIPLMAQIIAFANYSDHLFRLECGDSKVRGAFVAFIKARKGRVFSADVADAFFAAAKHESFWLDLHGSFLEDALMRHLPPLDAALSWREILDITRVFSKIVDCKSHFTRRHSRGLEEKVSAMAAFYNKGDDETTKLRIAANLHDVGKLAVPNAILDKPGGLTDKERVTVRAHTYYTRAALQEIRGFEDITEWAANHHEKLDGSGYPYGLQQDRLDFNSRLLGCLDIYQALTEERPYRKPMTHAGAMEVLEKMRREGLIDGGIVGDIGVALADGAFCRVLRR